MLKKFFTLEIINNLKILDIQYNAFYPNRCKKFVVDFPNTLLEAFYDKSNEKVNINKEKLSALIEKADFEILFNLLEKALTPNNFRYLQNLDSWYKQFNPYRDKKWISDLIIETKKTLYEDDLNDHVSLMNHYCRLLTSITNVDWSFDGVELVSSKTLNKTANKMVEVLIAREILSGYYYDDDCQYQWRCKVANPKLLSQLKRSTFLAEINEASELISKITHKPCRLLDLYPVEQGNHYRILEKEGYVKTKGDYVD